MINMNFGAWVKVARTLANHASLSLQYVGEAEIAKVGAQAWTDGKKLYLRKPDHTWDEAQFKLWMYFLIHEIGHNTPSRAECWDILKDKKPTGFLMYILNAIEDHVQEHELYRDMPVLRGYLGTGRAAFFEYMADKRTPEDEEAMRECPEAPTLFAWDTRERVYFMPDLRGCEHAQIKPVLNDPRVLEWTEKLVSGDYASVLKNFPSPQETWDLAERILKEVFDQDPADQQQQEGDGDGEGEGEGESGDADEGQPGSAKGSKSDSKPGSEPGDGEEPAESEAQADYADLLNHNHAQDSRAVDTPTHGAVINYDEYFKTDSGTWASFKPAPEKIRVSDLTQGQYPPQDNSPRYNDVPTSLLSKRVGRYMQAKSKDRRVHGQKRGNLSGKSLYKLRVKGMSAEARQRVFNKKVVNTSKNVAVTIAVDMSGSMSNKGKAEAAIAAVTHLHSVLHQALRIPLEILGFSELETCRTGEVPQHVIVQGFNSPRRNSQVEADMKRVLPFNGANRDGEFLMWAAERLLTKRANRHIMIVLSDGQPRSVDGDVAGFTREVIQQIEKQGLIELHGIGICSESVRHFYSSYDVLQHVSELESTLLTVLRNKIIKHL